MAIATNLGFPRIGRRRELKQALEQYWAGQRDEAQALVGECDHVGVADCPPDGERLLVQRLSPIEIVLEHGRVTGRDQCSSPQQALAGHLRQQPIKRRARLAHMAASVPEPVQRGAQAQAQLGLSAGPRAPRQHRPQVIQLYFQGVEPGSLVRSIQRVLGVLRQGRVIGRVPTLYNVQLTPIREALARVLAQGL